MERWEVVLQFMVGSPCAAVSQDLAQLLVQAGLMKSEAGEAPYITSAGFQFLLLDTASQLWYFTLQYLNTAQFKNTEDRLVFFGGLVLESGLGVWSLGSGLGGPDSGGCRTVCLVLGSGLGGLVLGVQTLEDAGRCSVMSRE
ncbi:General transcription factor IIH subunit 4 [Liparis tanakae]|uniref:General transcription factor IIH subunit 4 n=1 Tax=Liparis tanakae TaxID=230148 RepID=A0A4Z2E5S2_9TELE|nr:General transcription factor IIH subunit 4 [Liparis tanakae]